MSIIACTPSFACSPCAFTLHIHIPPVLPGRFMPGSSPSPPSSQYLFLSTLSLTRWPGTCYFLLHKAAYVHVLVVGTQNVTENTNVEYWSACAIVKTGRPAGSQDSVGCGTVK